MSPDKENGRPLGKDDRSTTPVPEGPDTTVEQRADTPPAPRGRPYAVRLPESLDFTVAVLDSLAAGMPAGRARDLVVSVRTQLVNDDAITQGLADVDARRLAAVWPQMLEQTRAARTGTQRWDYVKLRREVKRHGIPDTTVSWYRAAESLAADGLPWFIMRDCLHDAVADRAADPVATALRAGRRQLARLRRRAEHLADVHREPRSD